MNTSPRTKARKRSGRCYELCFRGQMQARDWVLVHGTVLDRHITIGHEHAARIGHAWLERDGIIYDAVHDQFLDWRAYEAAWSAVAARRFSLEEADREALRWGVYGPFEPSAA